MPFRIIRNDITHVSADIIVNTANPNPVIGSGTDMAIYDAAGSENLLHERCKIGKIKEGEIAVTSAFRLPAKYIIHAVGPLWIDGEHDEFDILRSCYQKSLEKAIELNCDSIAFPLMATGNYGFPKDKALQIAVSTITSFVMTHDLLVYLVVFSDQAYQLSGRIFEQVDAYIDSHFVLNAYEKEYQQELRSTLTYSDEDQTIAKTKERNVRQEVATQRAQSISIPAIPDRLGESPIKSFSQLLMEYMIQKEFSDAEIYKAANMDRKLFNKIKNSRDAIPRKKNVLAICIGLHLTLAEAKDLLAGAGYAFNPYDRFDCIVQAFLDIREYNIGKINSYLFDHNLETF